MTTLERIEMTELTVSGRSIGAFTTAELREIYDQIGNRIAGTRPTSVPEIERLLEIISEHFQIERWQLNRGRRPDWLTWPRHVALYFIHLAVGETHSTVETAAILGLHHSMGKYARIRVMAEMETNPARRAEVEEIREKIKMATGRERRVNEISTKTGLPSELINPDVIRTDFAKLLEKKL
jgi:chromosomal replication initiation ATPase DnaA